MATNYQHWQIEEKNEGVLWLYLDRSGEKANTINHGVLLELDQILDEIIAKNSYRGVVLTSHNNKPSGFCMGADIREFDQLTPNDMHSSIEQVHKIFHKLESLANLKIITVALIQGFCLGGGLELALSCRYQIAEMSIHTQLGFPEVKLGLHPGWGGMIRGIRKMGLLKGAPIILSGKLVNASEALTIGLIDEAVPKRYLEAAALRYIQSKPAELIHNRYNLFSKPQQLTHSIDKIVSYFLHIKIVRIMLVKWLRKQLAHKVNINHYPAPYAMLDYWAQFSAVNTPEAFQAEADSFISLIKTDTSKNLVRLFLINERMKKLSREFKIK